MYDDIDLREVPPALTNRRAEVAALLTANGLAANDLPPYYIGAYDSADRLVAGGGLDGNVIKCVAVSADLRGTALLNRVVSRLLSLAQQTGQSNVFVFTKPAYVPLFSSLAFYLVGQAPDAALLESDPRGIATYTARLRTLRREGRCGVAVMNCNPLTRGHLYLIREALRRVDTLYIIPLSDDRQLFTCAERTAMLTEALREVPGVVVCPSSDYLISRQSFPAYFIKEASRRADAQIALDCDIFSRHVVPALRATCRFVGSEPTDAATARYNELLHERLNMPVVEVLRLTLADELPVSASAVRRALTAGCLSQALPMVAPAAVPYVLACAARQALLDELRLTPKPGLVQPGDCGAHRDMTPALMERGIEALYPYFVRLALSGRAVSPLTEAVASLRAMGIEAEAAMLRATRGVNTHKGALFALGLTVAAAAYCYAQSTEGAITTTDLRRRIQTLAAKLSPASGTHGDAVKRTHGVPGATEMAQSGYAALFDHWLPAYRRLSPTDSLRRHRLLLTIMAELDDTNIYHRGGAEAARYVKLLSRETLDDLTEAGLRSMGELLKARNLSPGGSADMLALTLLIDSLTEAEA